MFDEKLLTQASRDTLKMQNSRTRLSGLVQAHEPMPDQSPARRGRGRRIPCERQLTLELQSSSVGTVYGTVVAGQRPLSRAPGSGQKRGAVVAVNVASPPRGLGLEAQLTEYARSKLADETKGSIRLSLGEL